MTKRLRRFVAGGVGTAGAPEPDRCELCGQPVAPEHGHLVAPTDRAISCACHACYLLFTGEGAGGGRYRAVPRRYRYAARLPISEATWDRLAVPVGMAFFFHNSTLDRMVALYPSPAGATESQLDLAAWADLVEAAPELTDLAPDVEALLVNRTGTGTRFEGYLVPIDACYQLVGLVRTHWRGFAGGEPAWQAIRGLLAELRQRAVPVRPAGPPPAAAPLTGTAPGGG